MRRVILITSLILAGELVFGLPFHTNRFFRSTFLEVFNLTNTQMGDVFAAYGVVALLAYFPGGVLADRFSARGLLATSLFATAAGGLYMATIPNQTQMAFLFAYFGFTSIFLLWGALIRATRDWGGGTTQGMAFGLLEGGRGLVAAAVASIGIVLFASLMPADVASATAAERHTAFVAVIYFYTGVTAFAGLLVWLLIPVPDRDLQPSRQPLRGMLTVLRRPVVWAQAAIVVCAYCGYKGTDNYGLYAEQVLGMNELDANRFATWGGYVRPFAAIVAGIVADRFAAARSIVVGFVLMLLTSLALASLLPNGAGLVMIYLNIFVSFFAVFALRGVYFALLEENRTPVWLTGTTVGMVSFIGFTPEVFFGPITGRILDAHPGAPGFHNYFLFLAMIALAGILVTVALIWMQKRRAESLWPVEIKA